MKKQDFLLEFIAMIPTDGKILDVGCGTGKMVRTCKEKRKDLKISAIDIRDVRSGLHKDISFTEMSAEDIGKRFEENSFDAIICQHVIEHLLYPTNLATGIKKILKKDGILLLETPNWIRAYFPFYRNFFWNDYTHVRIFSKKALTRLFADFGFGIEKEDTFSSIQEEKMSFSLTSLIKSIIAPFFRDTLIYIVRNEKR